MFGTIRKHSTWLWLIIITLTIISFVYFFSPDARYNVLGKRGITGYHINGRPVTSGEYTDALQEAKLRYFFRYGTFPGQGDEMARQNWDPEAAANDRLLLAEQLRTLNIEVGLEATLKLRDELLALAAGSKDVDLAKAMQAFEEQILKKNDLTLADFERFLRHEAGLQQLIQLGGVAGRLTTPQEAERIFRRENEELKASVVFFSNSNHLAGVTNFPPDKISQMYSNRLAEYAIPERVQLAYVQLPLTNYLAQAITNLTRQTNLAAIVDMVYARQPTNYWKDKDGTVLDAAAAKVKIEKEVVEDQARRIALRAMNEFTHGFDLEKTNTLADFIATAAKSNLTVQTTAPFDLADGPADLKLPERAIPMLFRLQESEPIFMNPLMGEAGAYLFALNKRLPREVPPLATVRAKVIDDYKQEQAREMAKLIGQIFHNSLTNGLAQGKSFAEICKTHGYQAVELPAFSRVTGEATNLPASLTLGDVRRVVQDLTPKSTSPIQETREGWMIVYLDQRNPVDAAKVAAELPKFLASLRSMRQNESASDWIGRQRQSIPHQLQDSKPKTMQPPMPTAPK